MPFHTFGALPTEILSKIFKCALVFEDPINTRKHEALGYFCKGFGEYAHRGRLSTIKYEDIALLSVSHLVRDIALEIFWGSNTFYYCPHPKAEVGNTGRRIPIHQANFHVQ